MDVCLDSTASLSPTVERAYESLLGALGTVRMEDELLTCVQSMVGETDRVVCYQRNPVERPVLFFAHVPGPRETALIRSYGMRFYRLDPVDRFIKTIPNARSASISLHVDEIENTEYRESWERSSIRHRLSLVKNLGSHWLALSVARRTRPFTSTDVESLSLFGRLALPLMAKNHALKSKTSGGNFSVIEMERRLENLCKGLTKRETQVCARTIVGLSAEGAALDLGISTGSVLTYRQRAYRRTGVSNAIQLTALVTN